MEFSVASGSTTTPAQATTINPTGSISTSFPTYYWQPVSNATHYLIGVEGISGSDSGSWKEKLITVSQANCSSSACFNAPLLTLFADNEYIWWVRAINNGVEGAWSNDRVIQTDPDHC